MAACNVRHLALAQKLESAVEQRLERAPELSEKALRNLAVVSAAAQRISRLALGASTENVHRNPYAQMTDAESRDDLLIYFTRSPMENMPLTASPSITAKFDFL